MNSSSKIVGLSMLLTLFCSPVFGWQMQNQTPPLPPGMAPYITATEAKTLEEGLAKNPDNLSAREKLIGYYAIARLTSSSQELEVKREQHVLWLIEHHPESNLAGSPDAWIDPMGFSGSTDGYQQGKKLWLEQADKHADNPRILQSAAEFTVMFDRDIGRQLLEKVLVLDPNNIEASLRLAMSYDQERMLATSSEEKKTLAEKALAIRERGIEKTDGITRFYYLDGIATAALDAGDATKAEQYATELLQDSQKFKNDWNYGNAVHSGNIVLGRLALQRGDIEGAKQFLLAAGNTPGSPQLDSFGPNMRLAKDLLDKGERDTVLTYLQSCAKFWKMGGDQLNGWIAAIKGGGTPDFGMSLYH